jgi:hypothetical protein
MNTGMTTLPISYVFHNIRSQRNLRHACRELPREWWKAQVDRMGSPREWIYNQALPKQWRYTRHKDTYYVMEVDEEYVHAQAYKAVGYRCVICGGPESTGFVRINQADRLVKDWSGETMCDKCLQRTLRLGSFIGSVAQYLRKIALAAAKNDQCNRRAC